MVMRMGRKIEDSPIGRVYRQAKHPSLNLLRQLTRKTLIIGVLAHVETMAPNE